MKLRIVLVRVQKWRNVNEGHSRRKHDITCLVTLDVVGVGLPSDNNFQPITSFVSIAMLGNVIVVDVTFLGYGGKCVTRL